MGLGDFERTVVQTLLEDAGVKAGPAAEREVEEFVAEGLRRMPPHLRLGVGSIVRVLMLLSFARRGRSFGRLEPAERREALRSWGASPLDPVRQYVRLMRSLVLFAANERVPEVADT